jgi:hypothetical protein
MTKWVRLRLPEDTDPLEALQRIAEALGLTYKVLLVLNRWGGVERIGGDEILDEEVEEAYAYGDGAICVLELFNGTGRVYATVYPSTQGFSELPYRF